MKKLLYSIVITTIFALGISAAALLKADFNGTWKLDASRSQGLPPGMEQTMTVTQTGDTVKIETTVKTEKGELKVPDTYTIDGKESDFSPQQNNGKGKRTAKWNADENGFEVSEKAEVQTPDGDTVNVEATRKWTLAADAKTLIIELHVKTPQGEQQTKRTFVKQ